MSVNAIFNAMAAGAGGLRGERGERPSERRAACGAAGENTRASARSRRDGEGREQRSAGGGEDYSQATQKLVAFLTSFEEDGLDDVDYTD